MEQKLLDVIKTDLNENELKKLMEQKLIEISETELIKDLFYDEKPLNNIIDKNILINNNNKLKNKKRL